MSTPNFIESAQKLFAKGKTTESLTILLDNIKDKSLYFDILELQRRNNTLNKKELKGIISSADALLEHNQINNALLLIIQQLSISDSSVNNLSNSENLAAISSSNSWSFKNKKILMLLAGLLIVFVSIFGIVNGLGSDSCANLGGDKDKDGICAEEDCNDNDSTVGKKQTPGTICDDHNPATFDDKIQAGGCDCQGIIKGPCDDLGGDKDKDGICAEEDCNDNDPKIGKRQSPGAKCDDNNSATVDDKIQADGCNCKGIIKGPCDDLGGDKDKDGICANQDCNDNNSSIGKKQRPGTRCNDNNPATDNDKVQSNGCDCKGTTNPCYKKNCGPNGNCDNGKCICINNYSGSNCQIPPLQKIEINGTFRGQDWESIGSNELHSVAVQKTFDIDRNGAIGKFLLKDICIGGEVYGKVYMDASCQSNGTVTLNSYIELYESDHCPNTDLDGSKSNIRLIIPADTGKVQQEVRVRNDKENDDDLLFFSYKGKNTSVKK